MLLGMAPQDDQMGTHDDEQHWLSVTTLWHGGSGVRLLMTLYMLHASGHGPTG